jgi:gliding motility-associated protein GldE
LDDPPGNIELLNIFSGENLIYTLSFAIIIVLLLMSALISASEVAFFSLKSDDLDRCRQSNDKREKAIVELLNKPRELLATILIMNNMVNIGVVTISTFMMWEMTGTHNPTEFIVGIVTFGATFAITFFGEIIPKVYATKNNMTFARWMSKAWSLLVVVCKPISVPLLSMSMVVEKQFKKKGYQTTVEELNQALEIATVNNQTSEDEKEILKGIVNFGTLTVRQVMRSRMDISAADIDLNFIELMDWVNKSGFSRIPVYRNTPDKIEGVLYIKDLLPFMDQEASFEWQKLLRPGFFVPESKKIDSLLKDFQEKRVHMALVVDEYGGTSGLITMEDIIEEIIGEINDEFDEVKLNVQRIDENTFVVEGKISLHDFCKGLDIEGSVFDSVKGESESLGGLILELNNELPKIGEEISHDRFTFIIEAVDRKSIKRVRVQIREQKESH